MDTPRPTLGFIGLGKVGQSLARLLQQRGYSVVAVWNRHAEPAERLARDIHTEASVSPLEVVRAATITFLTVSDDALSGMAGLLSQVNLAGCAVVHTSGALDLTVLSALEASGAMIGSLHPIYPFADVESALKGLPGATFALEASHAALGDDLRQMVSDLDGQVIVIPPGGKPLYHAALVFASNYGVTLYALAEQVLRHLNAPPESIRPALEVLLAGMVANLQTHSPADALTGPLVRGDEQIVHAHLKALLDYNPAMYDLYRQLALLTLPLVEARGVETAPLRRLLHEGYHDTLDHP
jgi:predicted short-subunit dehydrogenase-like oxidoreductase (DUF2520 family)